MRGRALLVREISAALVFKAAVILLLYLAFFARAPDGPVTPAGVSWHLLSSPAMAPER